MQETQETRVQFLGQEDPLEEEMAIHSSMIIVKSHGQRSLVGYSPWGCKELDVTEQEHTNTYTHSWFTLVCSRNQHNIVQQPYSDKKFFKYLYSRSLHLYFYEYISSFLKCGIEKRTTDNKHNYSASCTLLQYIFKMLIILKTPASRKDNN